MQNIAILDVEYYVKETQRQLNSKENYKAIKYNPTTANIETANKVVSSFQNKNLLIMNISKGIKAENPQDITFLPATKNT